MGTANDTMTYTSLQKGAIRGNKLISNMGSNGPTYFKRNYFHQKAKSINVRSRSKIQDCPLVTEPIKKTNN